MTENKILIVSFKLGTKEGVGGRRWLVYGLELLKKGYDVNFLTFQKILPPELLAHKDRVFILESNYPKILKCVPKTLYQKLLYRFWIKVLSVLNKGTIFDESARLESLFLELVSKIIIDKKIKTLLISGAPFSLLYYGTLLKKKFTNLKLISDYRDGWTQGTGYGIRNLSRQKFNFELEREKLVLKISDEIFVASKDIQKQLTHIDAKINTVVLPNFVDVKQFEGLVKSDHRKPNSEIIITHIGSVNINIEKYWMHFFTNISILKKHGISVVVKFVGNSNKSLEEYVAINKIDEIEFHPRAYKHELAIYLNASHFLLFFKHDEFPDSFPTKFFDYVVFKKPLLCYSLSGSVTEEIILHNLGFVMNDQTSKNNFLEIFKSLLNETIVFNDNYNWSNFSLDNCVLKIEKFI